MKKLLAFMIMLLPVIADAFTGKVEIDGIYYNVTTKANVAEVTFGDSPYSYEVVTIPSTVEYEGTVCNVTSIGTQAFYNCTALKTINLPSSIITIDNAAFAYCSGLTDLLIPENVTTINGSFEYCTGLKNVTFPASLSSMYTGFRGCTNLENVYISDLAAWCKLSFWQYFCNPLYYAKHLYVNGEELTDLVVPEGVTTINNSFWGFNGLKTLVIPEGVNTIAACAFGNCNNLVSVSIANTVTKIDYSAFKGCKALKQILIPNSVKSIGEEDFKDCPNLETVIFGSGLDYLGPASFSGCTELRDVYIYTEKRPATYYTNTFANSDINYATLHVRENLIPTFKNDVPWKNFGSIVRVPEIVYMVDGEIYSKDIIMVGTAITPIAEPEKVGHTFSGWSEIPEIMPIEDVNVTGSFTINSYTLTYKVDGVIYKTEEVKYGTAITPEAEPTKTGYTFSGWIEIPQTMPASDVTIEGHFTINKYNLQYIVDGEPYKTIEVEYDSPITPEVLPVKEGHTFSGWSSIPERMPANDVTVAGTFSVNSYILTYIVDDEVYKTYEVNYGTNITPEDSPTKTGYTFSGWSEFPSVMPAKDVTISGTFYINSYKLIYMVDGAEYKSVDIEYDSVIIPEAEPTKEGHTFSGWSEIPEKMPANDVTVTGVFTINKYIVTYIVDGNPFATDQVEYATKITPPDGPQKEGYTFAWGDYPETMPANDITIIGGYTINQYILTYLVDGEEYKVVELDYNSAITPEAEPSKEGYSFSGWSEIPETMPANNVTVTGSFIVNKYKVTYIIDGVVFTTAYVEYGAAIVPPTVDNKEGYTFDGWADVPETMPAHDIIVYGSFTSGITEIHYENMNDIKIYTANGKRIDRLQRGVNIIRYSDGRVRKISVK